MDAPLSRLTRHQWQRRSKTIRTQTRAGPARASTPNTGSARADVLKEAKDFLAPLNACLIDPAKKMTLGDFVSNVWLPSVDNRLAASTAYSHRYYWENIIEPRCGGTSLREFSTARVQQLLDEIRRQNPEMMKGTLSKVKSILSAIFKHAIQQEYRLGPNPTRETSLPRAPEAAETFAYDLDAVLKMLRLIPEPSRTVIAVAAFTGLRRSEVEGLTWENYFGDALAVTHGIWNGIVGETKNRTSKASVPVIGVRCVKSSISTDCSAAIPTPGSCSEPRTTPICA